MSTAARELMEGAEFLRWCLDQEDRHELVDGIPVKMMSGASEAHDRVVTNIIIALGNQLRGTRCRPATADVAVNTRMRGYRRPDVTVTCGEPRADSYAAQEPRMIVEVLSPSNVGVAWQRKLEEYRRLDGLAYLLLVDSGLVAATLYVRTGRDWDPIDADGPESAFDLPAIGCRLGIAEIYDGLSLPSIGRAAESTVE